MKKRTRIASLVAAVAMTVSALPMAALPALAIQTTTEGDHGTLTNAVYQIRKQIVQAFRRLAIMKMQD